MLELILREELEIDKIICKTDNNNRNNVIKY